MIEGDWSSDVCSSDLVLHREWLPGDLPCLPFDLAAISRSEERRVGKDADSVDLGGRRIIKKRI